MRLIDADALESKIIKEKDAVVSRDTYGIGYNNGMSMAHAMSVMSPTIDAVPVVRCRDCVWYEPDRDGEWIGCYFDTELKDDRPNADDFCSRGERRSNE